MNDEKSPKKESMRIEDLAQSAVKSCEGLNTIRQSLSGQNLVRDVELAVMNQNLMNLVSILTHIAIILKEGQRRDE